ncbi:MAG: selenium-dependent xanthine dehydrogenase [Candidatus Onthomonas sp.]
MANFIVNGTSVHVSENQKLLPYLRDVLHLTSVKDGCSEGACGTCTVLVDGKAQKACVLTTDKLEGKTVLTVEGLSPFEQEVYVEAFGQAGAVQCGFCIPGMVIAAKALLDQNPDPTEEEIAFALRGNLCRCTGYVKIKAAVRLAARMLREGRIIEGENQWTLGSRVSRVDVREKVLGYGKYPDDVYMDNMLHVVALRSAYPRARVDAIDTAAAKAMPGVAGVFTAEDIPGQHLVGHIFLDWPAMIGVGEITHFLGDVIAIVAAETVEQARAAADAIRVDYTPLKPVRSPEEAMAPDAPQLHENHPGNILSEKFIHRGNADAAIARSKYVISKHFSTPYTEHAFLEPECAVSYPEGKGVHILSTDQSAYSTQHETAPMLGLLRSQVRVENMLVGGGFGGKEDVTVQHLSALAALLTGRPCKMKLTRAESLLVHPKRHPMEMDFTIGCDENGNIQGVKARVISDTGAYASLGSPVLERACTHAAGPYHYENLEIDGIAYYTNNPPAGAFRGFGVTQTCFAMESLLNEMADLVGISPWEIRYRNAIRPGEVLPNGQIVGLETGLVETLEAVKPYYDQAKYVGIACAMKNAGVGVGLPDYGRCKLRVENGQVVVYTGASCIGQGLHTVLMQFCCTLLDLAPEQVRVVRSNTFQAPDSGVTSGSRQTLVTGEACRRACEQLKAELTGKTLADLEGKEYFGEYLAKTDPLGAQVPNPVSHVAYGYATQICILDDQGKLKQVVAAHDVGKAVNPLSCEGQIEGGVVMSLGFALTEQYPLVDCKPTAKFGTLGLFRANQVPEIKAIVVEKPGLDVACGAIGIGEITSIPTAPAVADAYFRYDGLRRTSLPLEQTPYARKKPKK